MRPNSGRIEPGESVEIAGPVIHIVHRFSCNDLGFFAVMLQAMKEEPPLAAKCRDKFLIQSTIITWDKQTMPLQDIVCFIPQVLRLIHFHSLSVVEYHRRSRGRQGLPTKAEGRILASRGPDARGRR